MKRKERKLRYGLGLISLLLTISGCEKASLKPVALSTIQGAEYVGSETCAGCHDELSTKFMSSIHGRIASFEISKMPKGCESCHGPGSKHAETGDPENILRFKNLSSAQKSGICLQCHAKHHWDTSEHSLNDVSCTDCHKIHDGKEPTLLAKSEPQLCFNCHKDIRNKTLYPSRHPIWDEERTGRKRMTCSSCHDVHGSPVKSLKTEERVNDLCLRCHARYQGPFIFEHQPVVEDCTICHDPHGSVANNLLKQNEPFLCLQCHEFHFHAGKESGVGEPEYLNNLLNSAKEPPYTGPFPPYGFRMAFTTKCTQCHPRVHGSDYPSLSVPGQGKALTR
jgi:DmsE family decaheme c-type cytochrome